MDDIACAAIAMADFGQPEMFAEIRVDSQAKVHLRQIVLNNDKKLHFWLHFVEMPVQIGAVTSPQSMMAPPEVRVEQMGRD